MRREGSLRTSGGRSKEACPLISKIGSRFAGLAGTLRALGAGLAPAALAAFSMSEADHWMALPSRGRRPVDRRTRARQIRGIGQLQINEGR
jgi:hypothetical protein